MTHNLKLFSSLDKLVQNDVTLGNNTQVTIMDKGNVGILTKQGKQNAMTDAYFVKGLKDN